MKILFVSDIEDKGLWDYFVPSRVAGVDLIISCGDLDPNYLEFLVTMVNRPLYYVRGNHDTRYDEHPPQGCQCIDDTIVNAGGLRILGLGGSMQYKPDRSGGFGGTGSGGSGGFAGFGGTGLGGSGGFGGGRAPRCMYTESEMHRRIRKLRWQLRRHGGIDILVTHAPALGYGDMTDLPHRGFACFNDLLQAQTPRLMAFGHVHRDYGSFQRTREHPSGTLLLNAWQSYVWDSEG